MIRYLVRDEGRDAIVLDRSTRTTAPGRYSLWLGDGGCVHLGEVVDASQSTAARPLLGTFRLLCGPGARASWSYGIG